MSRRLGNVRSVANWTRALGGIALTRGDYPQARLLLEESLEIHRTLADPWGISHSLSRLALVSLEAHDNDTARRLAAESLAIERETGDRPGQLFDLRGAGGHRGRRRSHRARRPSVRVRGRAPRGDWKPNGGARPARPRARSSHDLRSALGEEAFAEAWEQGQAMTLDEALDYALEEEPDPDRA